MHCVICFTEIQGEKNSQGLAGDVLLVYKYYCDATSGLFISMDMSVVLNVCQLNGDTLLVVMEC